MNKRLKELGERIESLPFDAQTELNAAKAANGCFPYFIEAEKSIDDLLKHDCSHLEAKREVYELIEGAYSEAFFEGLLKGFAIAKENGEKGC